jgi:thiol-disulfide isomerase/thioredoxin
MARDPMQYREAVKPWYLLVLAMLLVAWVLPTPARAVAVGDTVQLPSVTLIDGRTLSADSLRGKPVVIQVWATWCPFCAMQNPRLQKLYTDTRSTALQVLTIAIDPKPETVKAYVAERKLTFPVTMSNAELKKVLGAHRGIPEVIVLDRTGRVVAHELGEMLEEDVAELAKYAK